MARRETTVQLDKAVLREKVLDLRMTGMTYENIGRTCNISHGRAHTIVTKEMKRLDEKRRELAAVSLQLDLARLDKLTAAHWARAMAGELPSGEFILKLIGRRARILGYDNPVANEAEMIEKIRQALFVTQEELSAAQWQAKASVGTEEQAH